jgi:dihydrolipoamide dehydrogenase
MSDTWDVLVIGAGPGGYPAAIRAAQLGLKTACIEREKVGGVCLNWGCIPTKALLKTAEFANQLGHADDFGLSIGDVAIDFAKVIGRSRGVAERFGAGVKGLFKKYGVSSLEGSARLTAPGTVEITTAAGTETHTAKHVVIATGARARWFPGIEPDGERILTYREAIVATERPPSITILGAGAIGIEFAYFYNAMGSQVTVIEGQDEILPVEDREVGKALRRELRKQGITFKVNTFVDNVRREGDETITTLASGEEVRSHTVLISLGIRPNTEDLGLEEVGIGTDRGGFIEVDTSHQTAVAGFYAVGDCCSAGPSLAHTATRQAHVCIERIAGLYAPDVDYSSMPSCTYCQPQVASVGMTEAAARAEGRHFRVGRFPFAANGKAWGAGHPEGFVKVLIDDEFDEILGAHIIGAAATEMIAEFVLAKSSESLAETIVHTVHAHPTASEASLEAVAQGLGISVHI